MAAAGCRHPWVLRSQSAHLHSSVSAPDGMTVAASCSPASLTLFFAAVQRRLAAAHAREPLDVAAAQGGERRPRSPGAVVPSCLPGEWLGTEAAGSLVRLTPCRPLPRMPQTPAFLPQSSKGRPAAVTRPLLSPPPGGTVRRGLQPGSQRESPAQPQLELSPLSHQRHAARPGARNAGVPLPVSRQEHGRGSLRQRPLGHPAAQSAAADALGIAGGQPLPGQRRQLARAQRGQLIARSRCGRRRLLGQPRAGGVARHARSR